MSQFMSILAQQSGDDGGAGAVVMLVVMLAVGVITIAGMWKSFAKAGEPGIASIIPIYNLIVLLKIAGKPSWWLLLFLFPFVNILVGLLVFIDFAKAFGKGTGFGLGLWLFGFIFFPMLGFGDAKYVGVKAG